MDVVVVVGGTVVVVVAVAVGVTSTGEQGDGYRRGWGQLWTNNHKTQIRSMQTNKVGDRRDLCLERIVYLINDIDRFRVRT